MSTPTATSPSPRATSLATAPGLAVPVGGFLAGFGPVALLGFSNGGYEVSVVAAYGVALWWLLLVGVLSGALPRPRPTAAGWVVLAAIALLVVWAGVTLGWSASSERGLTEIVRLIVVGGSLLLGMVAVAAGRARLLVGGVASALVLIVAAGVLSRLLPDLFAGSSSIAEWLDERRRLSWPLNYWNGMGAAAGIGIPLCLTLATRARHALTSAAAAAAIPVLALGLVLTLSRGGVVAAAVGLLAAAVFVAPRLVLLRTALAPALGSVVSIAAVLTSDPLREAVGGSAQTDAGSSVLPVIALATVGVALAQAGWHTADGARWTPRLPRASGRWRAALPLLACVLVVGTAVAADAPGRVDRAWQEFKAEDSSAGPTTTQRLTSAASSGRYEEWTGAVRALRENPLGGIGLGSWESWWSPRRDLSPPVRNAHSAPLEIAAETGVPGLLLFLTVLLAPLVAAGRLLARSRTGSPVFAMVAVPALLAFFVAIGVDWAWQLSALPVAALLVSSVLVSRAPGDPGAGDRPEGRSRASDVAGRLGLVAVSLASIGVLAVALIAPSGVDRSQAALASGDPGRAAHEARDATHAAPFALSPVLQQALVAEQAGDLATAAAAAAAATRVEPGNWRPWMVLSRIEVARNRPAAALAAFRRARALNPRSPLLKP